MFLNDLKNIFSQNKDKNPFYVRNFLKESIQYYVLHFVSQSKWNQCLVFKGGTCLRIFFDLPRLSEDLDFDIINIKDFDMAEFIKAIRDYFKSLVQYDDFDIKLAGDNRTLYLRFPILNKIGMTIGSAETNIIFVRIDVAEAEGSAYSTEIAVKSYSHFSLLIKRYSLPDLMASKIAAILTREKMEGTTKMERLKGRDYYDLIWYLEKNVSPNWDYLTQITGFTKNEAIDKLTQKINTIDLSLLSQDLTPFFQDNSFVKMFSQHFRDIYASKMLK